MALHTPILFCIFNRPAQTTRVFEAIRRARPTKLLVIQDGPRANQPEDVPSIAATRQVLDSLDWPCELIGDYATKNLGCKQRMASGISWAFEQTERLIILEDDCLPHHDFFGYCETLLDRYASDERVMTVSGDSFQPQPPTRCSYYFSKWTHIWGWASWRRAWQRYDLAMSDWPIVRASGWLESICPQGEEAEYWTKIFDQQHAGEIDTWDFPWMYAHWRQGGLTILPKVNLVTNIGFGEQATHTKDARSPLSEISRHALGPLEHPSVIERHAAADAWTWQNIFKPSDAEILPATARRRRRWWSVGWRRRCANTPPESLSR